jgi:hypothetical protein
VTLTATPNAGDYFAGWTGATNSLVSPLNITMNNNYVITGSFSAFPTYPLTLATNGQGGIGLSPAGPNYASNTLVTATATPASGWVFTGWTGSAAGSPNPLSFNMNASNSLTGNFGQLPAIDIQPVSVTNKPGAIVGFTTHAVGTAPLAYRWSFNGVAVPGATNSSLSLTNVQFASAGSYQLQVTNGYGSTTSSVALLVLTNGLANPVSVCDEPDLRAAIAAGGWIQFGCNGTITITNTIVISNNVILDGSLVSAAISGGNTVRLFRVLSTGQLTVTNLALVNGTISNTNIYSDLGPVDGGAIYINGGTVNLIGCQVNLCRALDQYTDGGFDAFNITYSRGGAIFNNGGTLNLLNTTFSGNTAAISYDGDVGLGGAIFSTGGTVFASGCNFYTNSCSTRGDSAAATGGAIYLNSGTMTAINCSFILNSATGGHTLANAYTLSGYGGAIAALGGNLILQQCRFFSNSVAGGNYSGYSGSGQGGALYLTATSSIANSFFFQNSAALNTSSKLTYNSTGGGIQNTGLLVLNGCCLCSNTVRGTDGSFGQLGISGGGGGLGGGVYNAGQFFATNCTVALNTALAGFGDYFGPISTNGIALGAGIYNASNATAFLMNVTIASNTCNAAGMPNYYQHPYPGFSAGDQVANLGGTLSLHNSLLAYAGTNGNAYGTITDVGYNFSSDGSAAFASGSSFNYTDPKLSAIANNGGPTLTMALAANSPAIDYGDSSGAPNSDQRGYIRPFGASVDAGAFEYGSYAAPPPGSLTMSGSSQNCSLHFTASPPFTYHVQWSTNLTSWSDLEVISGLAGVSNVVCNVSPQGATRKFYRYWYQ